MKHFSNNFVSNGFAVFCALVALSAIAGGSALITMNGLGMPTSWLSSSPFVSYTGPGLILIGIIGGTYLAASVLLFKNLSYALEAAAIAGFGLIIFEFFEVYITLHSHFLQIFYFGVGIVTILMAIKIKYYIKKV